MAFNEFKVMPKRFELTCDTLGVFNARDLSDSTESSCYGN
jgi:hypothetical protein